MHIKDFCVSEQTYLVLDSTSPVWLTSHGHGNESYQQDELELPPERQNGVKGRVPQRIDQTHPESSFVHRLLGDSLFPQSRAGFG